VRPDMTPRDICMTPLSDFWFIYAGECRIGLTRTISRLRADAALRAGAIEAPIVGRMVAGTGNAGK